MCVIYILCHVDLVCTQKFISAYHNNIVANSTYHMICIVDFKSFSILMIGRLLGGIATSLLFSVFEAWLIGAHSNAGVMVRYKIYQA